MVKYVLIRSEGVKSNVGKVPEVPDGTWGSAFYDHQENKNRQVNTRDYTLIEAAPMEHSFIKRKIW